MKIGDSIEVEVRNNIAHMAVWWPATSVFRGVLVENFPWASADEICMTSGQPNGFVRTIHKSNILRISTATQTVDITVSTPPQPAEQTWTVAGSKGAEYTVSFRQNQWRCNCVAGQFGKNLCRHIKAAQASLSA